jgi:hypothetical protein
MLGNQTDYWYLFTQISPFAMNSTIFKLIFGRFIGRDISVAGDYL